MRLLQHAWLLLAITAAVASTTTSTDGVTAFITRRLPDHAANFQVSIDNAAATSATSSDRYTVSSGSNGKIQIQGTSPSAVLQGLHRYLADVAHVDIWWFVGSELDKAPKTLPRLNKTLEGASIVPYRYHWNTVTTSYTSAFWSWEDWELQLDWMALRGVNLALAWIGVEKIFTDVFLDIGLTQEEINSFLSGPAFLAWQHFGNIQGSWGGDLPQAWIDDQFALQRKIIKRMVELGMTPILPAFPGFVPENITRVWPNVSLAESPTWSGFSGRFTADKYITPYDPRFAELQKAFLTKQNEAYGNVTSFWTLDQFNENKPASGELEYLRNVSHNTWQTLKDADPSAVWVMQGWLFASDKAYWTDDRVKSFLDGVPVNEDMLLLDLFAESTPQWQRTDSFYGKPWIWCQLHGYGGNMGLYGQIENVTRNAVEAVQKSPSIAGLGLSMEGQEGNEIMYNLLLDQAWSKEALETDKYFSDWVTVRYGADQKEIPKDLYTAWDKVRSTVYNNTDSSVTAVAKSIFELVPSTSGLVNRTGHHATKITYDTETLISAWNDMFNAGSQARWLFDNEAYSYDLTDWTRQVLANAFEATYNKLVEKYKSNNIKGVKCAGSRLQAILRTMDQVLETNVHFRLSTWIQAARKSGGEAADFFEYNARNQVTLWGPNGEIEDYASKQWAGLIGDYYAHRWQMFVDYLVATDPGDYDQMAFQKTLIEWEKEWNNKTMHGEVKADVGTGKGGVQIVMRDTARNLMDIFGI
ncbi:hypothetical protein BB8028_0003g12050 [Beauveria bassiana]|uniref:Alpha-N-acetylglucosaminidase n=1 Tax=Beauveria bassiana TaxID=176275 RepID=A0A2S7Y8U5_BEABA|nr:hypothetical protein BB8028_0003g12050 [Beauveria bassiana]